MQISLLGGQRGIKGMRYENSGLRVQGFGEQSAEYRREKGRMFNNVAPEGTAYSTAFAIHSSSDLAP